jgi:hypothetical protein
MKTKMVLIILIASWVLSACSAFSPSIADIVDGKYSVDDTVKSSVNSDDTAKIYIADQSMSEVAKTLKKAKSPNKITKAVDDKQVLVYDDYFVTLTPNKDDPSKTNIEVATYGFVRDNYQPSFFDGLLTYYMLDHLFGVNNWAYRQGSLCRSSHGCYRGYTLSGGHYKGPTSKPLFRSSPFRGGGPSAGK